MTDLIVSRAASVVARAIFLPVESILPRLDGPRRKLRMWWSTTVCQLFEELVAIGNMTREGLLEHPEECLRDCWVLVVSLKIRDGLALMIDIALAALNAAFGFLDVSLQERSLHRTSYRSAKEVGHFLLDRRHSDRNPLRRAMHDNRNNHRAETEAGLRRMGQPSGRWTKVGPRPRAPEVLAPMLQLSQCLAAVLSRITYRAMRAEPVSCAAPKLNRR